MGRLSYGKRTRIYILLQEGHNTRYIASKENVSQSTVIRINQKVKATGSVKDLPRTGRSRIFTGRNERNIVKLITTGECSTSVWIHVFVIHVSIRITDCGYSFYHFG